MWKLWKKERHRPEWRKSEVIGKKIKENFQKIQKAELTRKAEGKEQDIWWNSE